MDWDIDGWFEQYLQCGYRIDHQATKNADEESQVNGKPTKVKIDQRREA